MRVATVMLPLVAVIVAGAVAMVDAALTLADAIGLSYTLLIFVVVTSLPNMPTAIRLARQSRGDATVSETLNSNTINLVCGILVPALILGLGNRPSRGERGHALARTLTIGSLGALAMPRGMGRTTGTI